MSLLTDARERFRALIFRQGAERDLADELRFHVEREVEYQLSLGATPEQARQLAMVSFGGVERFKDEVRDARGVGAIEALHADVKYALRGLRRNAGFAASTILVLGLALGACATIFAVADTVLFAPLPYPSPNQLVQVFERNADGNQWALSTVDAQAMLAEQRTFSAIGFVTGSRSAVSGAGEMQQVGVRRCTVGFLAAVGIPAAVGRLLGERDEEASSPPVAVINHAFATQFLGGAQQAIDKVLVIDGVAHTVVGVFPPGVREIAGSMAPIWTSLKFTTPTRRGPFWLQSVGRLKAGVTLDAARADLAQLSERIFPLWDASGFHDRTARLTPFPLRTTLLGDADRQIRLFGGAVALVLLIAVANVATLMLVRVSGRAQELAVRMALGAVRARIGRLLVVECVVLTMVAGVVAMAIAYAGTGLAARVAPDIRRISEVTMTARTLVFLGVCAMACGLLVSVPALMAGLARARIANVGTDSRRAGTGKGSGRIRTALVIAEFALALPLLVGAGLLMQSLLQLQSVNPGFEPNGAISISVNLQASRYPQNEDVQKFWRQLEQQTMASPAFDAAGFVSNLPPDQGQSTNNFNLVDKPTAPGEPEHSSIWNASTPGYFAALRIPLLEGRMFTVADSGNAPPVVLVSKSWARRYYPEGSPVGKTLIEGGCDSCPRTTVIGVVGDVKYLGLAEADDAVYQPIEQSNSRTQFLVAHVRSTVATAFQELRDIVRRIDPGLAISEATLKDRLNETLAPPVRWASVLGSFAVAAVLLAAVGVFGLMSYTVRQQRREIGVRLALGAAPVTMIRMILSRGLGYALVGTTIGLGLTILEARWLSAFLFGVTPLDAATMAAVTMVVLGVAAVACWFPALRAGRIRPLEAMSAD